MAAIALGEGPQGFSFEAILMQFTRLSRWAWRGDLPGVYPPRLRMCAGTNWLKSVMLAIYLYHVAGNVSSGASVVVQLGIHTDGNQVWPVGNCGHGRKNVCSRTRGQS